MIGLETGYGYWSPVIWLVSLIVIAVLILFLRSLGKKDYKKEGGKDEEFFSGNEPPEEGFRGDYWGFFEVFERYYKYMKKMHSGLINDYMLWFLVVLVLVVFSLLVRSI